MPRAELVREQKIELITGYVRAERERLGVTPRRLTRPLPEPSCEAFGAMNLLMNRQLIPTQEGYGAWSELANPRIVDELIDFFEL